MLCYNSNSKVFGKVSQQGFFSQTIFFFLLVICHISFCDSTCAPLNYFSHICVLKRPATCQGEWGRGATCLPRRLTRHPRCVSSRFLPQKVIDSPGVPPLPAKLPQPDCLHRWISLGDEIFQPGNRQPSVES